MNQNNVFTSTSQKDMTLFFSDENKRISIDKQRSDPFECVISFFSDDRIKSGIVSAKMSKTHINTLKNALDLMKSNESSKIQIPLYDGSELTILNKTYRGCPTSVELMLKRKQDMPFLRTAFDTECCKINLTGQRLECFSNSLTSILNKKEVTNNIVSLYPEIQRIIEDNKIGQAKVIPLNSEPKNSLRVVFKNNVVTDRKPANRRKL